MPRARRLPAALPLALGLALGAVVAAPAQEGAGPAKAEEPPWTQLSLGTCRVDALLERSPQRDGRGVVVAVLDTGVDPAVPGLRRTTTGAVKVIDVQDFSGQGDVALERVHLAAAGGLVRHARDGAPERYGRPEGVDLAAAELWFGQVREADFRDSDVSDLDDDGRTDDVYGLLVVAPPGGGDEDAVVFVDTDGDRDWSDERPLRSYRLAYDTFTWARARPERQIEPLTFALNVLLGERKVVLCFDDGGHGTHVAGIAAGRGIGGQEGFDGVAPGAQVISLKIGDARLAGGATTTGSMKRAFEYAARFARERGVQVVCNLSYGIDSELEGRSDVDRFLDELCRTHPELVVCTSAGNSGPGLSSVGTPAAARRAISVAALLAPDTARDVMGEALSAPQVAAFSSRGGELRKPDLATPGYATSTVPRWVDGDAFWSGTSMASPYAAGLCALLLSPGDTRIRAAWVATALARSATPPPGTTALDVGAGVPDVVRAAALLDEVRAAAGDSPLVGFAVETESPLGPGGRSEAAFWRTPWFPADRPQAFRVAPVFAPTADANRRAGFSGRYLLESDAPWLRPRQEQVYLRGEEPATVHVDLDAELLREPGLYVGTVTGRGGDGLELRLQSAVVVPHRFGPAGGYRLHLPDEVAEGWVVRRHFFAVPPGASAMHLALQAPPGAESSAGTWRVCRPDGTPSWGRLRLDTAGARRRAERTIAGDLVPGVWELPITHGGPAGRSPYALTVRFSGLSAEPERIASWSHAAGGTPGGDLRVRNAFELPVDVAGGGEVEGYRETAEASLTAASPTWTRGVGVGDGGGSLRIAVAFSKEDYARFTDVAVTLRDGSGAAVARDALGGRRGILRASPAPGRYTLEVVGGFTHPRAPEAVTLEVEVDHLYAEPIPIAVTRHGSGRFTLYPGVASDLAWRLERTPPAAPDGTAHVGVVRLLEAGDEEAPVLEVPLERR